MDLGVGLPATLPTATGSDVLNWARRAEEAGFASVGTIDRLVYGSHETIPTLAAASAVTSRIRLMATVIIAPFRGNGTLLAKQLATVDSFADGRLTVGLAGGARAEDFAATGTSFEDRGAVFDAQLAEFNAVWAGERRGFAGHIGPSPVRPGGPPLMIGGTSVAAFRRAAAYGAGWIAGGGGVEMFNAGAERARRAWSETDREGEPRLAAVTHFALGPDARLLAETCLGDYYAFMGDYAATIAAGALTSEDAVRDAIAEFAEAGCDELLLFPCSPALDQLHRLTEITHVGPIDR
ncbi:MAG: LLM class flavin-dependent oxidoreductase [Actinomycetota bacterium]|nr:LLM class flavin-dependent oxidoreductase [Actinomycetota bacterium]